MTLRELINHRATTQAAVARSLGWKPQTLSKYVSGKRSPKLKTALNIAAALDAVVVMPSKPGKEFRYRPAPEPGTQEEIIDELSYLEDAESDRENG